MDEARLIEKLRLIEALFSGAATEGEKIAAERARNRILERLKLWEQEAPPVEYRFSMADLWSRKVFVALLRRYGIRPYRYSGQRYTTVMARVPKRFVDETLWPQFKEFNETLHTFLTEVTDRVVAQVIHQNSSEAELVAEPGKLPINEAEAESGATSAPAERAKSRSSIDQRADSASSGRSKEKRRKRKKRKRR